MGPSPTALHFPVPGRILLVTNLLDLDAVLPLAVRYALKLHAQLKLFHVLLGPDEQVRTSFPGFDAKLLTQRIDAELLLSTAALQAQQAGVDCSWALPAGNLSRALVEIEDAWTPDRIMVFRREARAEWEPLDPVTELVLRGASVPVLVVGAECHAADFMTEKRKMRILFATSLDREADDVAALVLRFARSHQAELTMLHVIDCYSASIAWFRRVRQCAEQRFREMVRDFGAGEVRYIIEHGRVAETLLRVAKRRNYDFILIGFVSGASFRTDIQPGAAYKIVCEAPCPVLVLRRDPLCLPSGAQGVEGEITLANPYLGLLDKNL